MMGESLRVALAVVLLAGGWGALGYAFYLHYAVLPDEHTSSQARRRSAWGLGGLALLLLGGWLLS